MKKMNVFLLSVGFLLSIQSSFADIKCVNIESSCHSYVREDHTYYDFAIAECRASIFISNDDNTSEVRTAEAESYRQMRRYTFDLGIANTSLAKERLEAKLIEYRHYPSCEKISDLRAD